MLERYGVWANNHVAQMKPEVKGDWVRYSDVEAAIADLQGPFKTAQAERDEQGQLKARLNRDYNLLQNEHLKLHEKVKQEAAYTKQVEIERDALHERVAQLDGELACQKVETNGANERAQIVYQSYRETMDKFTDLQADHATLLGLVQDLLHPTKRAVERQHVLDALAASLPAQPAKLAQGGV